MNAPFRPLSKPSAQLLTGLKDRVVYRCFCGRKASTVWATWDAGIHHCNCTGRRIPFPTRDLIGQRFQRLTVTAWAGKPHWDGISPGSSNQQYWQVRCDCGQTLCLPVYKVVRGNSRSCGCQTPAESKPPRPKAVRGADLSSQVFGKLTALYRVGRGERKTFSAIWLCQCECGKTKEVAADNLKQGRIKSCGCLRQQLRAERGNDLTGQRFGMLTVIELDHSRHFAGQQRWRTLCDCGKEFLAWHLPLRMGQTSSCGCARQRRNDKPGQRPTALGN